MQIRSYTLKAFPKENENDSNINVCSSLPQIKLPPIIHYSESEKMVNLKNEELLVANVFPFMNETKENKNSAELEIKKNANCFMRRATNLAKSQIKNTESEIIPPNFFLKAQKCKIDINNLSIQKYELSIQKTQLVNQIVQIANGGKLLEQIKSPEKFSTVIKKISKKANSDNEPDHKSQNGLSLDFQDTKSRPKIFLIDEFNSTSKKKIQKFANQINSNEKNKMGNQNYSLNSRVTSADKIKERTHIRVESRIQISTPIKQIDSNKEIGIVKQMNCLDGPITSVEKIKAKNKYELKLETTIFEDNFHPYISEGSKINDSFGIFPNSFHDNCKSLSIIHMNKWKKEELIKIKGMWNSVGGKKISNEGSLPSIHKKKLDIEPENLVNSNKIGEILIKDYKKFHSNIVPMRKGTIFRLVNSKRSKFPKEYRNNSNE